MRVFAALRLPAAPGAPSRCSLGIRFLPVKEHSDIMWEKQQAGIPDNAVREGLETEMPPVIRSVLELSHLMMAGHSQWLRGAPGYQGGLFHLGSPYCFAGGYRDNHRPREMEERGNHMKLKDPLVYGQLSLPITSAFLIELHGKGIFDLQKPLVAYLPQLSGKIPEHVTARTILSFTDYLDDHELVREMLKKSGSLLRCQLSWNACSTAHRHIHEPLHNFLSGTEASANASSSNLDSLVGKHQRQNLFYFLCSSNSKACTFKHRSPSRARPSHFAIALLLHAVENEMKEHSLEKHVDCSFESSIRKMFFERAESHGAGYGPPKLWRSPHELFYQPTGLALQHSGFKRPIPKGESANSAPPVFNGSLNLYAPSEDFAKLLLLSLEAIRDAQKYFGNDPFTHRGSRLLKRFEKHYDFGVEVVPQKKQLQLLPSITMSPLAFIPSSASFRYACEHELGCFGIASSGSRSAQLFSFNLSRVIQHLYLKHALQAKDVGAQAPSHIDPSNPPLPTTEQDGATLEPKEETKKIDKFLSNQRRTKYFPSLTHYKNF